MKKFAFVITLSTLLWACNNQETEVGDEVEIENSETSQIDYAELGSLIATQTQQALGGELKAAMQRGGVAEAVGYCNLNAIPITDSLAAYYNVSIKRATAKPRNPQNMATEAEQEILTVWEGKIANAGEINPVLFEGENVVDFYSPIIIQPLCTACHGIQGQTITAESEAIINQKYPDDKATGYAEGDLRGMWHVSFKK